MAQGQFQTDDLAAEIGELQRRLFATELGVVTLATAESATGGGIASHMVDVPGASAYFLGGIVAYSNGAKQHLLGVKVSTLSRVGAVSGEVAGEMAEGGRKALGAHVCVADTGVAGPGGATPGKPVGLFYIGLATPEGCRVQELRLNGDRASNRRVAVVASLTLVRDYLLQCCVARGANNHECL